MGLPDGIAWQCVEIDLFEDSGRRQLAELHPLHKPSEVRLLKASALEAKGDTHDALNEYESLLSVFTGLEALARYGLLLQQAGHTSQAQDVFHELLVHAKRFKITLEAERDWIRVAQQNVSR